MEALYSSTTPTTASLCIAHNAAHFIVQNTLVNTSMLELTNFAGRRLKRNWAAGLSPRQNNRSVILLVFSMAARCPPIVPACFGVSPKTWREFFRPAPVPLWVRGVLHCYNIGVNYGTIMRERSFSNYFSFLRRLEIDVLRQLSRFFYETLLLLFFGNSTG